MNPSEADPALLDNRHLADEIATLRAQLAQREAELAAVLEAAEIPAVIDESTLCPECGNCVEWRSGEPDIGDHVVCDECAQVRLQQIRAVLANLPAVARARAEAERDVLREALENALRVCEANTSPPLSRHKTSPGTMWKSIVDALTSTESATAWLAEHDAVKDAEIAELRAQLTAAARGGA